MATEGDLERTLLRLGWRLDALDEWRTNTDRRLALLTENVEKLSRADEIAAEVARRVRADRLLVFSVGQKVVAGLIAAAAIATAVQSWVH